MTLISNHIFFLFLFPVGVDSVSGLGECLLSRLIRVWIQATSDHMLKAVFYR